MHTPLQILKTNPPIQTIRNPGTNTQHVFKSSNQKFASVVVYEDFSDCVRFNHFVTWTDPITNNIERTKATNELFIIESDEM